jgi:hypothetical protein
MTDLLSKMVPPESGDLKKFLAQDGEEETAEVEPEKLEEKPEEPKVEKPEEKPKAEAQEPEEPIEEPREEKKEIPFNAKHPRFKRVWKELEESRQAVAELKAWKEEQERKGTQASQPVTPKIPQAFIDLFGDNEEAWAKYQELTELSKKEAREEMKHILEEKEQAKQAQAQAQQKAVDWAEDKFAELADETGIDLSDRDNTVRNQILSICERYDLFTQEGMPNIGKAFELHQELYQKKDDAIVEKRQIIAKTNNKTNSSTKESEIFTPSKIAEIKKRGGVHFFMNS